MKLENYYIEKDALQIAETPWQLSFFTELEGLEDPIINRCLKTYPDKAAFIYRGSKKVKIIFTYENTDNTLSNFNITLDRNSIKEFLINLDYNILILKADLTENLVNLLKAIKEKRKTKISVEISRLEIIDNYAYKMAPSYKTSGEFSDYKIKLHGNSIILNLDTRDFTKNK